jgi:hypothetical protein
VVEPLVGSAGDVLEDDPVGRLKVFVYELPSKYNKKILQKDPRCLAHMFAAEIFMHRFLLSSAVRTLNPEEADWFYTPVYTTCDLTPNGLPLPFKSPRMMRSAIQLISSNWPYWNRTEGADHFFVVPHDFGACFHYQVRDLEYNFRNHYLLFISLLNLKLHVGHVTFTFVILFCSRKRKQLKEGFFHCCSVLPWFKHLDREIMCA